MMTFISVGDLSSSFRLRYQNAALRQQADKYATELSTGKVSDVSRHVTGNLDQLGAVSRSLRVLDVYQSSATEFATRATAIQASLDVVKSTSQNTGATLLSIVTAGSETSVQAASSQALEGFKTAISALNSQSAGQALFSGQTSDTRALISAEAILDDLEVLVAGAETADSVHAAVEAYFTAPGGGFEMSAYLGSATPLGSVRISENEVAKLSITAANPEIREALQGLATAALLSRDGVMSDTAERLDLLKQSGKTLLQSSGSISALQSEIGAVEARVETVQAGNAVQRTGLQISWNAMVSADPYETATKFQSVEAGLEALYLATARLSQLSLTRYLR